MSASIHPTAVIGSRARLGADVVVGPYAVIDDLAQIGDGSIIDAFAHILGDVTIGRNAHIHGHAVIGGEPQDHGYEGERSYVEIGDDVTLREYVTVNRATGEGCVTRIGSRALIMEGCHVAHNVQIGDDVTITNKCGLSGHVVVGDFAVIGGMTGFHQFVHVGSYAMVGGMSKIIKDVPPFTTVDGHPARVHGLNVVGLRRRGFSQEDRTKIKEIARAAYLGATTRDVAADEIEARWPGDAHAKMFADFMRASKRGLTKWAAHGAREEE